MFAIIKLFSTLLGSFQSYLWDFLLERDNFQQQYHGNIHGIIGHACEQGISYAICLLFSNRNTLHLYQISNPQILSLPVIDNGALKIYG